MALQISISRLSAISTMVVSAASTRIQMHSLMEMHIASRPCLRAYNNTFPQFWEELSACLLQATATQCSYKPAISKRLAGAFCRDVAPTNFFPRRASIRPHSHHNPSNHPHTSNEAAPIKHRPHSHKITSIEQTFRHHQRKKRHHPLRSSKFQHNHLHLTRKSLRSSHRRQ